MAKGGADMGKIAEKSLVDGVRAVELHYRVIRDISSGQIAAYQSQTRLNSPKLGVLTPDKFRDVCEITNQAIRLFYLELIQALEAYKTFTERELNFSWISVYMPVKLLKEQGAEKKLLEYFSRYGVPTSRICFELSEKLLGLLGGLRAAQPRGGELPRKQRALRQRCKIHNRLR